MAEIGIPDLLAFLCFFSLTFCGVPSQSLMYISAGIQEYSVSNISYVMECYHQHHKNQSCKDIDVRLQKAISDIQIWINVFKGVLGPICAVILGGVADTLGKKVPVLYIVGMTNLWALFTLVNCIFPYKIPLYYYLIQNGIVDGLCGGSPWTLTTFTVAYVTTITPPDKRAVRIGTMIAAGNMGTLSGPLVNGVILKYSSLFIISGIGSSLVSFMALLITVFCLKNVHNAEVNDNLTATDKVGDKFRLVIKFQFQTVKDICRRRAILPRLITSLIMYLLTTVALVISLNFVGTTYIRGAPFNWTNSQISFLGAGSLFAVAIQSGFMVRALQWLKFTRSVIARIGVFVGFISSFILAFATEQYTLILGMYHNAKV